MSTPGANIVVSKITVDEFLKMKEEWNSLLHESGSDTVFLTWEWLTSWWKAYGTGKELCILKAHRDGKTVGMAPFYRKKISRFGIQLYALAFLGDGSADSDYLDLISIKGEEEGVVSGVFDYLSRAASYWDILLLNEMPETSPHLWFVRDILTEKEWFLEKTDVPCVYLHLPSDWETYLKTLKPRMRTKIRSLTNKLEKDFDVTFNKCNYGEELRPCLESLFNLHNRRWNDEGKKGVFLSEAKHHFYWEMSPLFLTEGWLRL